MSETWPDGTWVPTTLSEIARVVRGRVSPQEDPELPFIGMDSVEAHTMRLLGTVPAGTMKSASVHFQPGDVLYGRLRPYLNKVFAPDFEGLASAEFIPLTMPDGVAHKFIQHRINASDFVSYASRLDEGDRPRVDYDQIGAFALDLPPSGEQHRIVEAIESYFTRLDAAVATLERVQRNLKRYRASVLKAAVEGRLVPTEAELAGAEGRDYEPASVLLERILAERRRRWEEAELAKMKAKGKVPKDDKWKAKYAAPVPPDTTDLPGLPGGWCWASIGQIADRVTKGTTPTTSGFSYTTSGIRFVRVENLRERRVDHDVPIVFISDAAHASQLRSQLAVGDVLFSIAGTLGRVAMVRERDLPANTNQALAIIKRGTRLVCGEYLLAVLESDYGQRVVRDSGRGGAMQNLSLANVESTVVPLAPFAEQRRVTVAVDSQMSIQAEAEAIVRRSRVRTARLRQSILKWAFEGRLVDQDPTDEPASVLLERIRAEREAAGGTPPKARGRRKK